MQSSGEADRFNDMLSGSAWPRRRSAQLDERHSKQHGRFWTFGAKIEKMRRRRPGSEEHSKTQQCSRNHVNGHGREYVGMTRNNETSVHPFSITALRVAGVVESIPAVWGPRRGTPSTSCQFMATQRDKQPTALTPTDNSDLPISLMFNLSRGS